MAALSQSGAQVIKRFGAFRDMLDEPYKGDVYQQAYRQGLRAEVRKGQDMAALCIDALEAHPAMPLSYLETKVQRATSYVFLGKLASYPHDFNTAQAWQDGYRYIFDTPPLHEQFYREVRDEEVYANISGRYSALHAFIALGRRMGQLTTPTVVDVGAGQLLGLKRIAGGYGFDPPRALNPVEGNMYRQLQDDNPTLGWGIGIDMRRPSENLQRARAHSFNPGELLDTERVQLFDELVASRPPNIRFFQGDAANLDRTAFATEHGDTPPDIFHFSMMAYQLTKPERLSMLRTAKWMGARYIVGHEFGWVPRRHPHHFMLRNNWQDDPMPCRTMVMDLQEPQPAFHELFLWQNGRTETMALGAGALTLGAHQAASAKDVFDRLA
ncbi:MAG TPA: hypothetical protein VD735_00445 [Candidatus Saccharimonadales bacterium]|nr:hypothetical protein [Candidatus Saccharimonadales bacterium]